MKTVLILATLLLVVAIEAKTALNNKHINDDPEITPTRLPPTTTTLVSPKERRKSMLFPKNTARFIVTGRPKIHSDDAVTSYFNQKQRLMPKINVNSNSNWKSSEVTTVSSEYEGRPRIRPSLVRFRSTTVTAANKIGPNSDSTKEDFTSDAKPLENSSANLKQGVEIDTPFVVDEDTTEKVTRPKSLKVKVHKKPVSSSDPEDRNSKNKIDKVDEKENTTQHRDDTNTDTKTEAAENVKEEI